MKRVPTCDLLDRDCLLLQAATGDPPKYGAPKTPIVSF